MKAPIYGLALLSVFGLSSCLFPLKYTVGGTVTGLRETTGLVLEVNSGQALRVASNGTFTFTKGVANGDTYSVTVSTQPSGQTCTPYNGSGTIHKSAVTNVIVHCTQAGRYAYVANQTSNTVSAFLITGGVLTTGSPVPLPGNAAPTAVTVDPNGGYLYVANSGTDNVTVYSIVDSTGDITPLAVEIPTGTSPPAAIAIDPTDRFLYVAGSDGTLWAFTIQSGLATAVSGASPLTVRGQPSALQTDPAGAFLYVTNFTDNNVTVFAIDSSTGALSAVSGRATGVGPVSIAVDPRGTFAFVANETADTISSYSVTASTGALTLVGSPLSTVSSPKSLAVNPAGTYLFAANVTSSNDITGYRIGSGALAPGTPVGAGGTPFSVAVDPLGAYLYVANYDSGAGLGTVSVFSVDSSGAMTLVGTFPTGGTGTRSIAID